MSNMAAYAAAIRINDQLIEVCRKIDHNMPLKDEQEVRTALLKIASALGRELEKYDALTPERSVDLSAVQGETAQADSAAKAGRNLDVWAALTRAHGCINKVMVDVMDKMG